MVMTGPALSSPLHVDGMAYLGHGPQMKTAGHQPIAMSEPSFPVSATMLATLCIAGFTERSVAQPSNVKSVTIHTQVWMSENLNTDRFRNGDPIPEARTDAEGDKAGKEGKPAWCHYMNNASNGART